MNCTTIMMSVLKPQDWLYVCCYLFNPEVAMFGRDNGAGEDNLIGSD